MKMYSVKDGESDRDNKIVTDGATIKVNTRNSGKSAILEKAKEIREMWSSQSPNQVPPCGYVWDSNGQILDVKSMYPEQLTLDDINNVQIHGKVCQELTETYKKKNADYGNSFENSLDKHGLIAGIVRMDDKMSRLISLNSKKEQLVLDESMRDTLMDLANYAIMSVMWLDNKSGEESDIGSSDRDIYADNQKLDIDKALREGVHPQAIRDFLGGADYDGKIDTDRSLREGAPPKFIRNFLTRGYGISLKEGLYDGMIGAGFGADHDGFGKLCNY